MNTSQNNISSFQNKTLSFLRRQEPHEEYFDLKLILKHRKIAFPLLLQALWVASHGKTAFLPFDPAFAGMTDGLDLA